MEKNKHLTAEDRKIIEVSLDHNKSYAGIARDLGKDPTTISKEVKAHAVIKRTGAFRQYVMTSSL